MHNLLHFVLLAEILLLFVPYYGSFCSHFAVIAPNGRSQARSSLTGDIKSRSDQTMHNLLHFVLLAEILLLFVPYYDLSALILQLSSRTVETKCILRSQVNL